MEGLRSSLRTEITSQETEERPESDLVTALSRFLWCCTNISTLGSVGADGCVKCPLMISGSDPRRRFVQRKWQSSANESHAAVKE